MARVREVETEERNQRYSPYFITISIVPYGDRLKQVDNTFTYEEAEIVSQLLYKKLPIYTKAFSKIGEENGVV